MLPGLGVRFFCRPAEVVARALLGQWLISYQAGDGSGGRILETEAYLGLQDPASHAFRGRRHAGNGALYGPPGSWYIYRSYGLHWCMNLVTGPAGAGAAVLIRSIDPSVGLESMRHRRHGRPDRLLADGPGKLCQALGVTGDLDGRGMGASTVRVTRGDALPDARVRVGPRVGISKAIDWPLRFRADVP